MGSIDSDPATVAFRRLLRDATHEEQARVDALVVLGQRTVFVLDGAGTPGELQTIRGDDGRTMLPVFSGPEPLLRVAPRQGWQASDGTLPVRELGARQALRYIATHDVDSVVIDMGSEHAVEFARSEIEPLLALQAQRDSTGPYASAGKVEGSLRDVVRRRSSRPPPPSHSAPSTSGQPTGTSAAPSHRARAAASAFSGPPPRARDASSFAPTDRPPSSQRALEASTPSTPGGTPSRPKPSQAAPRRRTTGLRPPAPPPVPSEVASLPPARAVAPARRPSPPAVANTQARPPSSPTPAPAPTAPERDSLCALDVSPTDEVLVELSTRLRQYPEVEWACALGTRSGGHVSPVVGVRLDPNYRDRTLEIIAVIDRTGARRGLKLGTLLLDDPAQARTARTLGVAFYPWRRTSPPTT